MLNGNEPRPWVIWNITSNTGTSNWRQALGPFLIHAYQVTYRVIDLLLFNGFYSLR